MPFTIPDKGEGQNDVQSVLFQEHLDIIVAGILGADCVLSGGAVTAQGSPDMTVAVGKAAILSNAVLLPVTAGNVTVTTADGTNPRLDLIVADSSGVKQIRTGTAAANPKPPVRNANDVVLAMVYVPAGDTTIGSNQITDTRIMRGGAATIGIKKTTSPVTFNTTAAIQTYFTLTLPSGLFLAGQIVRVKCGGNFLLNSGTPTLTLTIAYGGTTMFADVSIAGAADADRGAWCIEFDLIAQANNDQSIVGYVIFSPVIAQRIAATTGIGDMLLSATAANNNTVAPFTGSAAVDSDAADRTLTVQWTMSVSNVADEIVMEYGVAELL